MEEGKDTEDAQNLPQRGNSNHLAEPTTRKRNLNQNLAEITKQGEKVRTKRYAKNKLCAVDTNLWISFLLTGELIKLDRLLDANVLTLLFSDELLTEFIEVARRPKFRKYFTSNDREDLLFKINGKAEFITVTS